MEKAFLVLIALVSVSAFAEDNCTDESTARKYCLQALTNSHDPRTINFEESRIGLIQKVTNQSGTAVIKEVTCMYFTKFNNASGSALGDSVLGTITLDKNCKNKTGSKAMVLGTKI